MGGGADSSAADSSKKDCRKESTERPPRPSEGAREMDGWRERPLVSEDWREREGCDWPEGTMPP